MIVTDARGSQPGPSQARGSWTVEPLRRRTDARRGLEAMTCQWRVEGNATTTEVCCSAPPQKTDAR